MEMEDQLEMRMSPFQEPSVKKERMEFENTPESGPSTSGFPYKRAHLEYGLSKRVEVALVRLPEYKISALRPPTPSQFYSEDESLSSSDSDYQDRHDDSSDSDISSSKRPKTTNNLEHTPIIDSSVFAYTPHETVKVRPDLPEEEIKVDMVVLARKKNLRWQRGKVVEIVTKEDGRVKYKVIFEEKGKSLVSGHHMAFDTMPRLEQLYVGARVVVKSQDDATLFRAGILAELPCRKNRLSTRSCRRHSRRRSPAFYAAVLKGLALPSFNPVQAWPDCLCGVQWRSSQVQGGDGGLQLDYGVF
ncbi:histone-lysine N-methyltransferase SETDB1-A-like isoform X2 [Dunckerocampus dactyliophorus]|uniref:histone-lysine N-methyltransferase SETDB1-A-like isoform X2 n=1 Tax=Dunckerocampus dactyliophorus TaxID=161453 RepID=UPI002404B3EE|nr:histone-lysine N-methyltransferase SETDB1-A-like isoform X2 [Dunckerocampus dactyliophorus]